MALIRTATELDIPAIVEIYAHYVQHSAATFEIQPPDCVEMRRRRVEILSRRLPYLAAESDGRVIGYAYAGPYRARPAYRFTVEDSVYIHPELRGQGLGRLLLVRLIEVCEGEGYRQMVAVIGDSGNAASIRLHERLGFRYVGVLKAAGRKFGRWIDSVLMQRALGGDSRLEQLRQLLQKDESRPCILKQAADFVHSSSDYRWVGLYDVDRGSGEVRNVAFSGTAAPAHPRFPIDRGLTGVAISDRRTVNIGDVTTNRDYLAGLGTTRSEIIVPIFDDARNVVGTIDVESDKLHAFSDRHQIFLEDCAETIRPLWKTE